MGLADFIRIARGNLTPGEMAERDAAANARRVGSNGAAPRPRRSRKRLGDKELRVRAAGISTLTLICHTDTWAHVVTMMGGTYWRDQPTAANSRIQTTDNDMVRVLLSGKHVVELLVTTAHKRKAWTSTYATNAIAQRLYDGLVDIVSRIDPASTATAEIPPLVLDDRPAEPA